MIRLEGALDVELRGEGMSRAELETWLGGDLHWRDVGSHHGYGHLGGLYGHTARDDDRGFAASLELPDGVPGCDAARWLGVNMGTDPWAYVMLANASGVAVLDASTLQHTYADGVQGNGEFTTQAIGSCLPEGGTLSVAVSWQMDPVVHVEDFEECE